MRYVVMLRGVNVGGRNWVPMADLRVRLAKSFANVGTYIQTGNVVLDAEVGADEVAAHIERELPKAFAVDSDLIRALVCDAAAFRTVVTALATRSRLARHLLGTAVYELLTVRNRRTTLVIAGMLDATETA